MNDCRATHHESSLVPPETHHGQDVLEVSIVMPCLNEERTVASCVKKARQSLQRLGVSGEVIVSDNGSTDGSIAAAKEAGARVVHCCKRGYGAAVQFGVANARGRIIVMGDADDSYDFGRIDPFVEELKDGRTHMVMGNRFRGGIERGAMPWKNHYIGNPILSGVLRLLYGGRVGDAHCGLRSFTRAAYDRIDPQCPGMEFASELVVKALLQKMEIKEVPTTLSPDGRNRPPHLSPWRDGWRHLRFLLTKRVIH